MADIKYTPQQEKVLTDKSENLLVSASAGSGKTATIIQKIYNLIAEENVDLQEMLVITFTESASLEMKMRLKDKLFKSGDANKFISEQIEKLPTSDISTIHGFCSKMLRKYFFKLDLNPNFVVLNENDSKFLKATALDKVISKYSKNQDDDFVNLTTVFGGGRNFANFKSNILSFYEFLCAVEDKENFKQNISKLCYEKDLDKNKGCKLINDYILANNYYMNCTLDNYLQKANIEKALFFEDFILKTKVQLSGIDYKKTFLQNRKEVLQITLPKLGNKKLSENDALFKEEYKLIHEEVQKIVKDLKKWVLDRTEEELVSDLENANNIINKFQEVEEKFEKEYVLLKQKRNALDFADLEERFLELLKFDDVRQTLADTYAYIFVDEYQDINSVQELIISKLLNNNNKLVMVGDIKQSIYRFRNSSHTIFSNKSAKYSLDPTTGTLVNLNENFRSNPEILNFVNSIFNKCMFANFGGVDYKEEGQLKGMTQYNEVANIPTISLNIISTSKENNEDGSEEDNEINKEEHEEVYSVLSDKNLYGKKLTDARKEAMIVANNIIDLVGKDYYDAKEKEVKKINFGDIAILSRGNEFLKEVSKVLLEYKIPIATNMVEALYKNIDVSLLLSLLKVVNNFHDDNSLSVVLTSFIGELTFDELWQIRNDYAEEFLYESVKAFSKDENAQSKTKNKIVNFINFVNSLRERLVYDSIYDLLNYVQNKYDFYNYFKSLPDGANRFQAVKNFVESFEGTEYNYDLNRYLDFVENYAEEAKFSTNMNASVDSVKLGTIHSSKGLEYPIVFLVGCGKSFSTITFKEEILKDKDYGLGLNNYNIVNFEKNVNLARNAITLNLKKEEKAEELRLLYVALTRAKNHLIMVGHTNLLKVAKINTIKDSESVNNFMPWILSGLSSIGFKALKQNKTLFIDKNKDFGVDVKVFIDEDFEVKKEEVITYKQKVKNQKDIDLLKNLFDFKLEKSTNIALKNTVSSMLQEHTEDNSSFNFEPKKLEVFENNKLDIDSAKLGTIYHKVMQKVNFENKQVESIEQIQKYLDELKIEDKYKNFVNAKKVRICIEKLKQYNLKNVKKEYPFLSYLPYNFIFKDSNITDKILIQGVADLLVEVDGKVYLIDYKTTKASKPDQLVEKYKVQLDLYSICLQKALNKNIEAAYIYSFWFDDFIKIK